MPMIDLVTNVTVSDTARTALARGLGEAIALIPGKDESKLMLNISGGHAMYFKGRDDLPMAYVRTDVSGKADGEYYQTFGDAVLELIEKELFVPKNNIYLTVREIPCWVVRGE